MEMKLVDLFKGRIVEIVTNIVMDGHGLTSRGYVVAEDEFAVYIGRTAGVAAIGLPRENIELIAVQEELPDPPESDEVDKPDPSDVN